MKPETMWSPFTAPHHYLRRSMDARELRRAGIALAARLKRAEAENAALRKALAECQNTDDEYVYKIARAALVSGASQECKRR